MKKKTKQRIFAALATVALALPVGLSLGSKAQADTSDSQTVTIHKLQYENLPEKSQPNTGDLMTFDGSKPLEGVSFTAYDVTENYYDLRNGKDEVTQDSAYKSLQEMKMDALKNDTSYSFSQTNDEGTSSLALPTKSTYKVNDKAQDAIYVIVETDAPSNVNRTKSVNMVVSLPVYNSANETIKDEVHLYPKNEIYGEELSFTKYGVDTETKAQTPLAGAQFKLRDVNKQYLQKSLDSNGFPVFSEENTPQIFTSDDKGVVNTSGYKMAPGTYTFEEIPTDINTSNYTKFDLVDTPNAALELNDITKITAEIDGSTLETKAAKENNGFRLSFFNSEADRATILANPGKTITVTYQMHVKPGEALETALDNTITFDNNFHPETSNKVIVKTYGKKFIKKDANTGKGLKKAEFKVKKSDTEFASFNENNEFTGWVTEDNATIIKSGENGDFEVKGLATGKYTLVETKAPEDYHLPSDPTFGFTISETSYSNKQDILTIPNTQSGKLPSTGGKGIYAFIAVGVIALIIAGIYFTRGRKHLEA
ncbi:MAG: pilin N-terminal domain-containing protein [Enterococcus gilvus]